MIQKADLQIKKIEEMDAKLNLILNHLSIRVPNQESMGR